MIHVDDFAPTAIEAVNTDAHVDGAAAGSAAADGAQAPADFARAA
ncbi:MAG: hypothetical protein ABI831_06440 [Betaproteobacteria bacterium]